jgi:hypothetical protein
MKRILGVAVLILWFAVPAHAQSIGGSIGGGGSLGQVSFHTLPTVPRAHFKVGAVRGGADFEPSSFAPYEQALAQGRAALTAEAKTLAEIARENATVPKPKARLAIVQDDQGRAILARL